MIDLDHAHDNKSNDPHVDMNLIFHHTELPQTKLSLWIDGFLNKVCSTFSWVWLVLVLVIVLNVILRYFFSQGRVELVELQWHLYAAGFLIGFSYCLVHDDHVRVDFLHDRFSLKTQVWVELLGSLFLLFPFILVVIYFGVPYVSYSWGLSEVSDAPGGLPARWFIKSFIVIGFFFLLLSALSRFSRITAFLFGRPTALAASTSKKNITN
jgi:TRAP-type mannitol/chloroaromatic compound transport system permease small subunit